VEEILIEHTKATDNPAHVHEIVRLAEQELKGLESERTQIMKRIGAVRKAILGLADLFGAELVSEEALGLANPKKRAGRGAGITKACRMALMKAEKPMSAREVCRVLQIEYPDCIANHRDAVASVTTVLSRLVRYGEAVVLAAEGGRRRWKWAVTTESPYEPTMVAGSTAFKI
jgi:hypothetical protein